MVDNVKEAESKFKIKNLVGNYMILIVICYQSSQ